MVFPAWWTGGAGHARVEGAALRRLGDEPGVGAGDRGRPQRALKARQEQVRGPGPQGSAGEAGSLGAEGTAEAWVRPGRPAALEVC